MKYVGIYTQQVRNNTRSLLLLAAFPTLIIALVWVFYYILAVVGNDGSYSTNDMLNFANEQSLQTLPWVLLVVGVWFLIAYFFNTSMVRHATGARSLERQENPRVYNIVENLTMTCGMDMPKINVIDTPELNAFASGIDKNSYTVTVTTGICDRLDDDELAGVIAHELTHIRNKDTRLLIVSIVFVGILSAVMSIAMRLLWNQFLWGGSSNRRDSKDSNGVAAIVVFAIVAVLAAIGYFFTLLTRFAISRKREYMADAGGAELCGNPHALANALRKISANPGLGEVKRQDVQQLFIIHPKALVSGIAGWFNNMFSTHPPTEKRIEILEQF